MLAATLLAAAPAGAALGGANPASFNHVPDLRSVTFGESGPDQVAWFTFDEPLATNAINPAQFTLGGYNSAARFGSATNLPFADAASVVGTKPNTVELRWTSSSPDFDEVSYGAVNGAAVRAFNGNQPNVADSTAVTGAKGQTGTRGHTSAPDLVGVRVDESNLNANVLIFTFDQKLDSHLPLPALFSFVKASGAVVVGTGINSYSDYEVGVRFPAGPSNLVTEAKRVVVVPGAVQARNRTGLFAGLNPIGHAAVPGTSGLTALPDLVSAELGSTGGSTSITYHYDEPIKSPIAPLFYAYTATDEFVSGSNAVVNADGTSVTVNFPNPADKAQEHFVHAGQVVGGIQSANGQFGIGGGVPIGGNAGALSTGWTSAPDATSATINKSNGQVDITLDSRTNGTTFSGPDFHLLDSNGDVIAGVPTLVSLGSTGAPGPQTIRIQFLPSEVAAATAIQIDGYQAGGTLGVPFRGGLQGIDTPNSAPVVQVVSASTTAAAIAPVGTSKAALRLRVAKTQGVLPAKVRKALKPTRNAKQARANAKVLKAFAKGQYRVKKVAVKRASKAAGKKG
ncbi:hypothetical protein PAI11_21800 [Patulibacter medicamentivorans]|uniref:Uncharacterized protein n=1 Tax=Patulibacter medicamentivorans TaxID=1097667 RepID=H0E5T1_9ACTN|nr:hypothetical protein PAI11_21800 [Patulibacter medicamentivorans]